MGTLPRPNYNKLSEINSCYQNSMTIIVKALESDESGNKNQAIEFYLKGLKFMEDGVRVDISGSEYAGPEWNDARGQQLKMVQAKVQTNERIYTLQESQGERLSSAGAVPSYAACLPEGHTSLSHPSAETSDLDGTTELLVIPEGVQIFFVSEDNHVGTTPPSYPTFLRVLVVNETEQVFLQVNDWTYPLVFGKTPVLKTRNGAYIFPNLVSNTITQGSFGIMISGDIEPYLTEVLDNILQNLALFRSQAKMDDMDTLGLDESLETPSTSDRIAGGLERGAEFIGSGLSRGAAYTSSLVKMGSEKLKDNLTPNQTPATINPSVQKGLYYTHEASKAAVKGSRFLVDGLCAITSKVGREIAPHIQEYGKKILPESATAKGEQGESTVDGVVKVAGAGLAGFGTIWMELERSGLLIARAVSSATVENVEFKYGKDAGVAASKVMGSAVNVGKTAFNLDNLGMKAIAKRTAKVTGKEVLKQYAADGKSNATGSSKGKQEPTFK